MAASGAKTPPLNDPTALARFGNLEMVARLIVEGYLLGRHRSPFKGASVEFVEHRHYTTGDEIRHIDWRAYAKTGEYYVKQFEEETNLRTYLLLDVSGSMSYAASTISKLDYGKTVAAALAHLLLGQRDACGLITFADRVLDRREPATQVSTFPALIQLLQERQPGKDGKIGEIIHSLLPALKRRSLIILITDGFDDVPPLADTFKHARAAGHDLILIQIAAPEEQTFPFRRPTLFQSLESVADRRQVDPGQLRQNYLERYRAFCDELRASALAAGMDHVSMTTSQPYDAALGAYLSLRAQRLGV